MLIRQLKKEFFIQAGFIAILGGFAFQGLKAEEAVTSSAHAQGKTPSFLYDVDFEMLYLDEIQRLSRSNNSNFKGGFSNLTAPNQNYSSTLGLRRAQIGFEWKLPRGVGVEVSLRPDALYSEDEKPLKEVDTRSGRVVEEMPSIYLMDEYRFVFKRSQISAHLGVEKSSFESFNMISDILDFGLHVRGPEKSFGVGLAVSELGHIPMLQSGDKFGFQVSALSGDDERHARRNHDEGGVGESPAKRHPYWGGVLNIDANLVNETKMAVGVAAIESQSNGAKLKRDWYHLGLRRAATSPVFPKLYLGMEARQLKQSSKMEETQISDESVTSIGVTSSMQLNSTEFLLVGFWFGSGDIHPKGIQSYSRASKSLQANLGWKWLAEDQLELVSMISREWRKDGNEAGGSMGGFRKDNQYQSLQSRFALQIRYNIGDQIL